MGVDSMNSYLADFLTMDLDKHLDNIIDFFFDFGAGFLSNLLFSFFGLILLAIVFVFPLVISKIVARIEEEHPKYAVIIDIGLILIVALVAIFVLILFFGISRGVSSTTPFYGSEYRLKLYYGEAVAKYIGVVYSLLINNCLLKKYFVKFKIEKYYKPIFAAFFVVFMFMFYYFYYLCSLM